jgi:hypothetical protein
MAKITDNDNIGITDADLKTKAAAEWQPLPMNNPTMAQSDEPVKTVYPTEMVDLPSKGLIYGENSALRKGSVEIRYMTAKEEDILTSPSLIQKGLVFDRLLQTLIVDKINLDEMVLGDKNALLVAIRRLAYGDEYAVDITCPECGAKNKDVNVDLSLIEDKAFPEDKYNGVNEFDFFLPATKVGITFKLLTHVDEKKINDELTYLKKITKDSKVNPELSTRLKYIITSVNGDKGQKRVREFVDKELLSRDSLALRNYIREISPDADMTFGFACTECDHVGKLSIPMEVQFFWPNARI